MIQVEIDEHAGFCCGVVKAIATAEQALAAHHALACLGDIVHNNAEVQRLRSLGLKVINHEQFSQLHNGRVLIRAHGEPPTTYRSAKQREIELIDATCPIVLSLQRQIRAGYEEMREVGGQVVIFGKRGHAEVIGLDGQTNNTAIIISSPDEVDRINPSLPIRLYSQTTKSREDYQQLIEALECKHCTDLVAFDTICRRVSNRVDQLKAFASNTDLLLFVCGSESSNGRYLYECSKRVQPTTYMISDESELEEAWFRGVYRVGVTGATSTPRWLMERVRERIYTLCSEEKNNATHLSV